MHQTFVLHDVLGADGGKFFGTDEFNHRLIHFDAQGRTLEILGGHGKESGQFFYPCGIERVGSQLFVADSWNHRVQVFDLEGRFVKAFGSLGSALQQFEVPLDLKLSPSGALYVVDSGNHRIQVIDPETWETVGVYDHRGYFETQSQILAPLALALNYPLQIMFHDQVVYLLEAGRLVRIDGRTVHSLAFEQPLTRQRMVHVGASEVLCFEPLRHCLNKFDFKLGLQTQHIAIDPEATQLFVHQGKVLALGSDLSVRTVAPLDDFRWASHGSGLVGHALEPDSVAVLEAGLDGAIDLDPFFAAFAKLERDCFQRGHKLLCAGDLPTHAPIQREYLTARGEAHAAQVEACIAAIEQQQMALMLRVRRLCCAQEADAQHRLWLRQTHRYLAFYARLEAVRTAAVDEFGRLRFATEAEEATGVHTLCARLFHLERLGKLGFKLLQQLKSVFLWFDVEGRFAAAHAAGQFVAQVPDTYPGFEQHLLEYLAQFAPECYGFPSMPAQAFQRARWAIERALAHGAALRLDTSGPDSRGLFQTYTVFAERLQLFHYEDRLHRSYGFPYHLIQYLMFAERSGLMLEGFLDQVLASEVGYLPSVRHDAACYLVLAPDPRAGIQLFQEVIQTLRERNETASDIYVSAVCNGANSLAQQGKVAQALDLLTCLQGNAEYGKARASILLSQFDFWGAREAIQLSALSSWPTQYTRGLIHLYLAEWNAAQDVFLNRVADFPENIARLCLGICYRTEHRFEEALTLFDQLEREGLPTLPFQKGVLMRMWGRDQEALHQFERQTAILPFRFNDLQILLTQHKLGTKQLSWPDGLCLRRSGQRIASDDPRFMEVLDGQLRVERAPLQPNADAQVRQAHFEWLEPLVNHPMFLVNKDVRSHKLTMPQGMSS